MAGNIIFQTAESVPFTDPTNRYVSENVQDALVEVYDLATGGGAVENAQRLVLTRLALVQISALKLVTAASPTEVIISSPDTYVNSKTLGIALTAANIGQPITVLMFGKCSDLSFNFSLNAPLFLNALGNLTEISPDVQGVAHHVQVGHSLGSGEVFINIREPIAI